METFSASLALCAGNSPVTGEFPTQRPVTRSFDVFFDLRLTKQLSKQSRRRWFETPLCSLWRHCVMNGLRQKRNFESWRNFCHWPEVVKTTTFGTGSNENFVKMTAFPFHYCSVSSNKRTCRLIGEIRSLPSRVSQIRFTMWVNPLTPGKFGYNLKCVIFKHFLCHRSPLQWRHDESDGISNHQLHDCSLNRLFRRIKENIKTPRHRPLCRNSPHKGPVTRRMFPFDDVIMRKNATGPHWWFI